MRNRTRGWEGRHGGALWAALIIFRLRDPRADEGHTRMLPSGSCCCQRGSDSVSGQSGFVREREAGLYGMGE